jgi:methionyl aminopeptidase
MIKIKTPEEIKIMTEAGKILAEILEKIKDKALPGTSTEELERLARSFVLSYKVECSFKGYMNYPTCLCTSINEEIVHAVPSKRILKEGDILSIDFGVKYKGFHSDMAVTVSIGEVSPELKRLIKVTKKSLKRGIRNVRPGNTVGDIGNAIQRYVDDQGLGSVRDLCGHGIGRELHEDPQILNYGKRHSGEELKEGMVICIEPMVTLGDWKIKKGPDGFAFVTKDNSFSAHFEHMMAITSNGCRVLTEIQTD